MTNSVGVAAIAVTIYGHQLAASVYVIAAYYAVPLVVPNMKALVCAANVFAPLGIPWTDGL